MSANDVIAARRALSEISGDAAQLGVHGGESDAGKLPSTGQRRRATRRGLADPVHRASLFVNAEGVLEWHLGAGESDAPDLRRGSRRRGSSDDDILPDGDLVDVFEYEALESNQVGKFLEDVDQRMNKRLKEPGRIWRCGAPGEGELPSAELVSSPLKGTKRRLLFVHGTFSKSEQMFESIGRAKTGAEFLDWAFDTYDEVLAFEHPTLSVSPILNALDLHRDLAAIDGPLDIVAHSRGGLVTAWTLETFGVPASKVRAVLVGSPLGGTSLASPPRLKATLGLLTNFGTALQAAGAAASTFAPFLLAPMAILKVATSVAGAVAKTPVLDGTISMIPGLAAQSRVKNNQELERLRALTTVSGTEYYVVTSDYQPSDPKWKFWEWFRGKRLQNAAADKVFPGRNDLVVDSESMLETPSRVADLLDYRTNATVHHTNYFEQPRTLEFLRDTLRRR